MMTGRGDPPSQSSKGMRIMASPSQTQLDRERKARINASHFDPAYIGEGGPINIVLSCGFVNDNYRKGMELEKGLTGYDNIKWE